MKTIETNGVDIHIQERPGGGYVINQGRSHLLLTDTEAAELTDALGELLRHPKACSPAKARLVRYPISSK
ncbi:MAG: hypothetical protein WA944_19445 [Mycobacterium sp.]